MGKDKVLDAGNKKKVNGVDRRHKTGSFRIFIIDKIFRCYSSINFMAKFYSSLKKGFFSKVSYKNSSPACLMPFGRLFIYLLFTIHYSLLTGCAMPKIVILDDPLSLEERMNLGVVYEKKGEFDNALKEYKLASKKLPLAYLYMGNIYFQKNEFDEAESAYKKAIKKNPDNSDAYNNLAWLYYTKKGNLNEAEELVLKAIELNPSKKDIYQDTLGKIRELRGQK